MTILQHNGEAPVKNEVQLTGKEELITVNVGNVRYCHGGATSENFSPKTWF